MVVPALRRRREDVLGARAAEQPVVHRAAVARRGPGGVVVAQLQLQLARRVQAPSLPVYPGRQLVVRRAAAEERLVERVDRGQLAALEVRRRRRPVAGARRAGRPRVPVPQVPVPQAPAPCPPAGRPDAGAASGRGLAAALRRKGGASELSVGPASGGIFGP